jgi:hypothetical protein
VAAVAAFILVFDLVDGARSGLLKWWSVLGMAGMLLAAVSNLVTPPRRTLAYTRRTLAYTLMASGLAFIATSLFLLVWR